MSDKEDAIEVLDEHSELIAEHGISISEIKEALAKQENEKNFARNIEFQKEIQSHIFERAQAYDNAIIIGGYAGYFALFSFTKEITSDFWTIFSALFLGISLTTYVVWQVGTMFSRGRQMLKYTKVIQAHPDRFEEELKKLVDAEKSTGARFQCLWYLMLSVAISTALLGALALMISFARYLLGNLEAAA